MKNILKRINRFYYDSLSPEFPEVVMVEPTNACNLKCIMCDYQNTKDDQLYFMSVENFRMILEQFDRIREFIFCGIGEPLLNRDIFKMIQIVKERHIPFINLITNGKLLSDGFSKRLLESGITRIQISLHSANPKTFAYIRDDKEESFVKLKENIKNLIRLKNLFPQVRVGINAVINYLNYKELPEFVKLGKDLGVDFVEFFQMTTIFNKLKDINAPLNRMPLIAKKIRRMGKGLKMPISFLDGNEYGRCYQVWDFIMIHSNGEVSPCNGIMPQEKIDIGNIFKTPLKEIWYSPKYQKLRRLVRDGELKNCLFCESGYCLEGLNLMRIKNLYFRPLKRIFKKLIWRKKYRQSVF